MKKRMLVILLAAALLVFLCACSSSGGQMSVSDFSVSETGDISASITPKADMGEVKVHVTAKDSEGKVNFDGELPLAESIPKDTKTDISFNLFDPGLWAGATMSYNPFGNMYESFLGDKVTCQLMADGKEIASTEIDTSKIDAQKALENLVSQVQEKDSASQPEGQEESASEETETQDASSAEQDTADAPAEAEAVEEKFFEAEGYKIFYEAVPQDKVEEVVGDLAQYVDTDGVDMETNRLFYIHYTSAQQNGEEVQIGKIWRSISWGAITFTVDGVDYRQPSILMSSGTQTYITYLFVPAETPDDAPVSLRYQK